MTSAWPQLEELIRELSEVSALPNADAEASLTEATIAVTKATTALAHAAQARGRSAQVALSQALATVDQARASLRQARAAIAAAAARQRRERISASAAATSAALLGQSEAACPGCGCGFVVRYRTAAAAPLVAFPVACPAPDCDGVSEVAYPSTAVEITVEILPAP
jgi:hypothetical protein